MPSSISTLEEYTEFMFQLEHKISTSGFTFELTYLNENAVTSHDSTVDMLLSKCINHLYSDFVRACTILGNLTVAKILYEPIKEYGFEFLLNDDLFANTCFNPFASYSLVTWLHSIYIEAAQLNKIQRLNIRKDRDYIFKKVCELNYADIADFFTMTHPLIYSAVIDFVNNDILHYEVLKPLKKEKIDKIAPMFIISKKKQVVTSQIECYVCYEPAEIVSHCGHYYCISCITKVFTKNTQPIDRYTETYENKQHQQCPYCREKLRRKLTPIEIKKIKIRIKPKIEINNV